MQAERIEWIDNMLVKIALCMRLTRCFASGENEKNPNGCTALFGHKCMSTITDHKILNANRD